MIKQYTWASSLGVLLMVGQVGAFAQEAPSASSEEKKQPVAAEKVVFKTNNQRDPMLSPDDVLLLQYRERQRMAQLEAQRRKREEEERRQREEEEKRRQYELMLLKDPSMLIRNKIRVSGIIDKEVLIGDKLYTIGNTYMGAKIIAVNPNSVTFLYKGQKFVRKLQL